MNIITTYAILTASDVCLFSDFRIITIAKVKDEVFQWWWISARILELDTACISFFLLRLEPVLFLQKLCILYRHNSYWYQYPSCISQPVILITRKWKSAAAGQQIYCCRRGCLVFWICCGTAISMIIRATISVHAIYLFIFYVHDLYHFWNQN